jgi:hypothetical protein
MSIRARGSTGHWQDKDPQRSQRVMTAMMQMVEIDIGRFRQAAEQG